MSNLYVKPILIFCFFCFYGCTGDDKELVFNAPSFPQQMSLEGKVLVDSLLMKIIADVDYYDSCLIVSSLSDEKYLHLYHRRSGKHLGSLLRKGRGSGEVLNFSAFEKNHESHSFSFFESLSLKWYDYSADSIIGGQLSDGVVTNLPHSLPFVSKIAPNRYLCGVGTCMDDSRCRRWLIVNDTGVVDSYSQYPQWQGGNVEDISLLYLYSGQWRISPDKKKMACVTALGGILEVFDLSSGSLQLSAIAGYHKPIYERSGNNILPIANQTVWGMPDLYVTDQYIYTLYCGNIQGKKAPVGIAVFNWDGQPVCLFQTNFRLSRLCVVEDEQKIYATGIGKDYETVLLEFVLPEIQ